MDKGGRMAFIAGVIISIIAGFFNWSYIFPILTVLGLIVGLLNVNAKEVQAFLLAGISLVIISGLGANQILYDSGSGKFSGENLFRASLKSR